MISRSKIKNAFIALSGAILLGSLIQAAPAEARHWHGWGGYDRHVIVHRHVVHRPAIRRVVHLHRPVVYRPRPYMRRIVVVERPYYRRIGYGPGWHYRGGYWPGWHYRHRHEHPRCLLPERYLCR